MGITFIARPAGWCRAPEAEMTSARLCHVSCAVSNEDFESGLLLPNPCPPSPQGFSLHPERPFPPPLPTLCPLPGTPFHVTCFPLAHPQRTWKTRHLSLQGTVHSGSGYPGCVCQCLWDPCQSSHHLGAGKSARSQDHLRAQEGGAHLPQSLLCPLCSTHSLAHSRNESA